jgi:hypothetical protein
MRTYVQCGRWAAFLALAAALVAGCGDECHVGDSECISSVLIQTCVPSDDGNEWLVHQCGANERCEDKAQDFRDAATEGDASADGGRSEPETERAESKGAACTGTCMVGEQSCVTPALARTCINGGVWQLTPCAVGQSCDRDTGTCLPGTGKDTVKLCKPGTMACASDKVAKICDADGSGWVELPCASNEICKDDKCGPDPKSSCDDDANTCLDNKTALRCLGGDKGFEVVKCEGDLYCEAGRCRGAVCSLGSLCMMDNHLRECVDGKTYRDSQCGVNQVCQQVNDIGKCVPLQCKVGDSACGDPRDASVDAKKNYAMCVVAAGGSGVPEWVRGECTGNSTCDPMKAGMPWMCTETCTKGAQRCASDPQTGVNDGFQTCGDDGKWGPLQTCNTENQSQKQCVISPNPDASMLPKALCAEPVCWWAFTNPTAKATGTCENEQLRKCQLDGTLADAAACAQGICRNVNEVVTADGHTPARCDSTPQCEEGEELCLYVGNTATPRYRTCKNGFWSTEISTCENDGACVNSHDDTGKRKKVCGAECSPASHRCNADGELETCDASGHWARGEQCALGSCKTIGNNDASCVVDCVPGSVACVGTTVTAPDGYHQGRSQQRVCEADGTWGNATACADNRVCRISGSGIGLGCIACVGPNLPGGNAEGSVDSRCDPNDVMKIQDCGENNNWLSSRTCSDGKACVAPVTQSCGMCMGVNTMFQCTNTNLQSEQVCAGCSVPLMGGGATVIPSCTQSAIAGTANTAATTCAQMSAGTPGNWAGQTDCCSTYQQTSNATCASRGFGAPVSWAGVADCCTSSRVGVAGTSFAYCD